MKLNPKNPMRSAIMSVLIFEIVVFWLGFAGMVQVSDIPVASAALWTGVASFLALLAVVGLRKGWGYYAGWAAQLAAIGLGFLTPWMFAMGIVFALIWVLSIVLGKRLDNKGK